MSKRKNLNDVIHGDRALARGSTSPRGRVLDDWDSFEAKKSDKPYGSYHDYYADDFGGGSGKGSYKTSLGKGLDLPRCYTTHPALKLPGSELLIHGGSCGSPVVKDADVFIGFDRYSMRYTERSYPWKKGVEFLFPIPDMSVPDKPEEFKKLVAWTSKKLGEGLKVHCGCIGGHGRTGTFLAALCATHGEKDAINYVRSNYCKRAVESESQIKFLAEHFGVKSVSASKSYASGKSAGNASSGSTKVTKLKPTSAIVKPSSQTFGPLPGHGCIWGDEPHVTV